MENKTKIFDIERDYKQKIYLSDLENPITSDDEETDMDVIFAIQ
jgi:hypothetical protein